MTSKDLLQIFSLIFKNDEKVDVEKQNRIVEAIDVRPCAFEIASYILRSAENKFRRLGLVLEKDDILKIIDSNFCIKEACIYLDYLDNTCEPSHFLEETFKI